MIILDPKLLKEFRGEGYCQWCTRWCQHREAAHVFAKQMGGGSQLDIRINLIALGGPWDCGCHRKSHEAYEGGNKRPTRSDLLAVVAARERTTPLAIVLEIFRLLREPKPLERR